MFLVTINPASSNRRFIVHSANYAGLFTVASYSICPTLLAIYSRKLLADVGMPTKTYYETIFSTDLWAWSMCFGGTGLIIYVVAYSAQKDAND